MGTAGWAIPRQLAPGSDPSRSALERYAESFSTVEINSTFYRLPLVRTVERWRDSTPSDFRFTVKVPQSMTHEAGLVGCRRELHEFCALVAHFEAKLGALLVQLPGSLVFDARRAGDFFRALAGTQLGAVVVEPRHASWFSERATATLARHAAGRVAADPARVPEASEPTAAGRVLYFRWHGSPRMYFSAYDGERLTALAEQIRRVRKTCPGHDTYCIFDNTGGGAAPVNARELAGLLAPA